MRSEGGPPWRRGGFGTVRRVRGGVAALTRYGVEVGSAFNLCSASGGSDLTAALGFTIGACKALSDAVLQPGLASPR